MPIDLKQFRQDLTYKVEAPVKQVLDDLQEIAEIDHLAEIKQKEYGKKALYYFLGIVITVVLMITVTNVIANPGSLNFLVIVLVLAIIGLFVGFIYTLVKRAKFSRINVINYRYQSTQRILQMLSRDMDANANIQIYLSFQPIEKDEHKISTTPHLIKPNWKVDNYQHEWLNIQGLFLDKTHFELSGTAISKKQYGWKRSMSGKSKYKSKVKSVGLDIHLNLTYSQRRYGAIKIIKNEINGAVKLPRLSHLRELRVRDKSIELAARIAPNIADNQEGIYQTVTAMFLSLYQVLNLAKALSR